MKKNFANRSCGRAVRGLRGPAAMFEGLESRVLLSAVLTNDPKFSQEWWLQNTGQTLALHPIGPATGTAGADIDIADAWTYTQGNPDVVIAVLDTGIDTSHPDLVNSLWTNPGEIAGDGIDNDGDGFVDDVHGWNFLDNNNDITDNFLHGTSTAGVIAATANNSTGISGVAPNVKILMVEVGTSSGVNDSAVAKGINYIIKLKKEGVNIVAINASYISFTPPTLDEVNAISNAGKNGMLYIAAAGNSSLNLNGIYPSAFIPSNMILVAATDNQNDLWSLSNYGSNTVALGAPGVDILTTVPTSYGSYLPLSGTSYAAPMVSGIVALLASYDPSATVAQLKAAVINGGTADPDLAGKTISGKVANAYGAFQYLIAHEPNTKPVGKVETLGNSEIVGYAFDANAGSTPINIQVSIDGVLQTAITADVERDDLTASLGSPDHGFTFAMPDLAYGKHAIKVYAVDSASEALTLIGSGTLTQNTAPIGALESSTGNLLTGYVADEDTPTKAASVKVYVDGKLWKTVVANVARPDLTGMLGDPNHGFSISLASLPVGYHSIQLFAVDTLDKTTTLIGETTLSTNIAATGMVETLTAGAIVGWAFDANAGSKAIQVGYEIDGGASVFVAANGKRTDLTSSLGTPNHGFSITLPQLIAGTHTITVVAVDPNSGETVQLASQMVTVDQPTVGSLPTGVINTLTSTTVAGTVMDDDATTAATIRVDVDGKKGKAFLATATPDPTSSTFLFNLPKLAAGAHRIDVYVLDVGTGTFVLLDRELVNGGPTTATVESLTESLVTGYAVSPNAKTDQSLIRVDIDGLTGTLVTAKLKRTDLVSSLGSANHGFSIAIPALSLDESHTISVYVIDPVTFAETLVQTETFGVTT